MARERDVRNAIKEALVATGTFDETSVWLTGLPEDYGEGASHMVAAAIEPSSTRLSDRYDGGPGTGLVNTAEVTITFLARHPDPQLRDEQAELLLNVAQDVLNGVSLAGFTVPDKTHFTGWRWAPPAAPERRITAQFSYDYPVFGWGSNDTAE